MHFLLGTSFCDAMRDMVTTAGDNLPTAAEGDDAWWYRKLPIFAKGCFKTMEYWRKQYHDTMHEAQRVRERQIEVIEENQMLCRQLIDYTEEIEELHKENKELRKAAEAARAEQMVASAREQALQQAVATFAAAAAGASVAL
eukprot:6796740-Prymnesium_polylepis.1